MFTKQHYVEIAEALNSTLKKYQELEMEWAYAPIEDITKRLIDVFKTDSPKFSVYVFHTAVWKGVEKDED